MTAIVFIGTGSNLGDRLNHISHAVNSLGKAGVVVQNCSPVYETPPWGFRNQPPFLNAVVQATTALRPRDLLARLQEFQREAGPPPEVRHGPRALDLDILFYENLILNEPGLVIPHPLAHRRWFVLKPLADLAPTLTHPVWAVTVSDLLLLVENHSPSEVGTFFADSSCKGNLWSFIPVVRRPSVL